MPLHQMDLSMERPPIDESFSGVVPPSSFIWRRLHSLMGLGLVFFLIVHLLTNSQAALWLEGGGEGFVRAVTFLKDLPYLVAIEILFLGIPFLIHGVWGVKYLLTARSNVLPTDGSQPMFPRYGRNWAYTWQRVTSWLLLIAVLAHVVHMRFWERPHLTQVGDEVLYAVHVTSNEATRALAKRLSFNLFSHHDLQQSESEKEKGVETLWKKGEGEEQSIAVSPSFGIAELLMVRYAFENHAIQWLYTVFVIASCFHAFNGVWTFLITWGVTLTPQSQWLARWVTDALMAIVTTWGLIAIWT